MAKKKKLLPVDITLIVDRSGSMQSIATDVIGGINAFYAEQKKVAGEATVTYVQFDDVYEVVFSKTPIADVPNLTERTFVPRGMTALNDAIGRTLKAIDKDTKSPQMIVVFTDGEENSSHEYTTSHVKTLVENAKERGWQLIFMGANIDAFKVGSGYGVAQGNIAQFAANAQGATTATLSVSSKMASMRSAYVSGAADGSWADAGGSMADLYAKTAETQK